MTKKIQKRMDHCLSKLLAENKRLTDNVCNIARQDYEKVRTVGTIMAVKITGYLELIDIGGSASGAGLFLSLLRVQLAPKLGGGGGGTIYDTTQWRRKGERQNIDGEYCVRGVCNDARSVVPKAFGVHPSKRFSSRTSSKV